LNLLVLLVAVGIIHDSDCKGARRAFGDFIAELYLLEGDLELVSTGTRVIEDARLSVKVQVFNFNLVVNLC
jgi:hypothetical protein